MEDKAPEPKIFKGACKVCGGDITEKFVQKFNAMMGPLIIGPGSKGQFHYVNEGLYCKGCGIKYEFVSEESQEEKDIDEN